MMNERIYIEGNDLYLSKGYLKEFASVKTIEYWGEGTGTIILKHDGSPFYLYTSIPKRTRKKLPPAQKIISDEKRRDTRQKIKYVLHTAYYHDFSKYTQQYLKGFGLTTEKATRCARVHSCIAAILQLKEQDSLRNLSDLHKTFYELFPGKYKTKQAFSQVILNAKVKGIESVSVDKRMFGNNDRNNKKITPLIDYVTALLVSNGNKYTNAEMIAMVNNYCSDHGLEPLSLSWMKKQRATLLKNPEVYKGRYGAYEANRQMPYATLKDADLIHYQWQVDGTPLPFWIQKIINEKNRKFLRPVLVIVIDNCSKKIIGYAVGNTEDGEVIKEAIRKAVYSTGVFPNEMVMDNHSFTKTQSAINFENLLSKVGAVLTKTSNPKGKVVVERYFQYLEKEFKKSYGFLGKGILSKSMDATPSKEMQSEFAKRQKTKEEVMLIVNSAIDAYNNTTLRKFSASPNQLFIDKSNPNAIYLTEFIKAELLPQQQLKQIRNGQITIMRGVEKLEYQLPALLHEKWNNEEVVITYDNVRDGIYLFDRVTGEGIVKLQQKFKINNSKALQTDEDIQALNRHKGRLKGIKTAAEKKLKKLTEDAHNIDSEAYLRVSALTTPKDVLKELEEQSHLKELANEQGIKLNEVSLSQSLTEENSLLLPASNNEGNPIARKAVKEVVPVKPEDFDNEEI